MIYNIILVLLFFKNRAMISALKNDGERRIFKGKGGIVDEKTILHGFVFGDAVRGCVPAVVRRQTITVSMKTGA